MEELLLDKYLTKLGKLNCAKINGKIIIAKPVFLLAILEAIGDKVITVNRFYWDTKSKQYKILNRYYTECYTGYSPNSYLTPLFKPFYHLKHDGFWHLIIKEGVKFPRASSSGFMSENLEYAHFDEDFWNIIQGQNSREIIRNFIVEKYIKSC